MICEAWVCGPSLAGIAGLNAAGGMDGFVFVVQWNKKMQGNEDAERSADNVQRENKRIKNPAWNTDVCVVCWTVKTKEKVRTKETSTENVQRQKKRTKFRTHKENPARGMYVSCECVLSRKVFATGRSVVQWRPAGCGLSCVIWKL